MRFILISAVSALALAACEKPAEPAAEPPPAAAEASAPAATAAMDETMAASDAADDAVAVVTPDNHTFHTYPAKIEIVRLPVVEGTVWSAHGYAESDLFGVLDSKDETLADGTPVHAVSFEMKASGNGKVVFERRHASGPDDGVLEARTVNFMIH